MPRKQKKYHYLYKTTNLINNKFYVGMHSTNNLNDGYLGSGKRLKYSISKYGVENFKIEYLEFFEDRKTLIEREKNFVNEDLIKDPMCMNLSIGGEGGLKPNNDNFLNARKKRDELQKNPEWLEWLNTRLSEVHLKSYKKGRTLIIPDWTGKKHSEETKSLMSEKAKLHIGNKNSQFGTCWVYNDIECRKIKLIELSIYLSNGWIKGRKMRR